MSVKFKNQKNNEQVESNYLITSFMKKQINLERLDKMLLASIGRRLYYTDAGCFKIIGVKNILVYPEGGYDVNSGRYLSTIDTFSKALPSMPSDKTFEVFDKLQSAPKITLLQEYGNLPQIYTPLECIFDEVQYSNPNSESLTQTYGYLCNRRGIDRSLVDELIEKRRLVMDSLQNLCFLEYENQKLVAIQKFGTHPKKRFVCSFHQHRNTCFTYVPEGTEKIENLYVFESCIEVLSYLTLAKLSLVPTLLPNSAFIAMNEMYINLIKEFQKIHTIQKIVDCTKNYSAKDPIAEAIKQYGLSTGIKVESMRHLLVKYSLDNNTYVSDWNQMLRGN